MMAHRFVYQKLRGPIPDGKVLCHKCDTKLCVNPDHMFIGTQSDNIRDCFSKGRDRHSRARLAASVAATLLLCSLAVAADRHVYLNASGGGSQLNDCANPAHNAKGTSNTDELEYCVGGGATAGKVIGTATGRITSGACTTDGGDGVGAVTAVTNGVSADVDGDGTNETVYGSPQACVWNMAGPGTTGPDSCEVHAGAYTKPGARAGNALIDPAGGTCERSECFNATFVALGNGPNMGSQPGSGYGSSPSNPGYLRGAVMNGSTDTWDSDGDKIPDCVGNSGSAVCYGECSGGTEPDAMCVVNGDCAGSGTCIHTIYSGEPTSYPAIFDGDADGDGTFWESTGCTDATTCTGDTFYAGIFGCGHENVNANLCPSSLSGGQHRIYIDADADGSFSGDERGPGINWNSSYLKVKDITFRHYNGGTDVCNGGGIRDYIGHFTMSGANSSVPGHGYYIDHMFWYDNFYSRMCANEATTAIWGDNENHYSTVVDEMSNSFIVSGNRFVINDDCGEYGECGGSKLLVNNRIVFPATRADGATWITSGGPGASSTGEFQQLMRIKSHDSLNDGADPKILRVVNNELIYQRGTPSSQPAGIFGVECFGSCWNSPYNVDCTSGPTCTGGSNPGAACTQGGGECTGGTCTPHPFFCCSGSGTGSCEAFNGPGKGEIWFNGNLVRFQGAGAPEWNRVGAGFCDVGDCTQCDVNGPFATSNQNWKFYTFNNTWDIEQLGTTATTTFDYICNGTGTKYVTRSNAVFGGTTVNSENATTEVRATCVGGSAVGSNCTIGGAACAGGGTCTASTVTSTSSGSTDVVNAGNTRTNWWTGHAKNAAVHAGLANYVPTSGGTAVLYEKLNNGACDPDGDGVAGVNYYGAGNVTTWYDIAGNTVSCPTINSTISYGAIQPNSDSVASVPPTLKGMAARGVKVTP